MVQFEIVSDRDVTIDGIGLLEAGKPVVVNEEQFRLFHAFNGYKLPLANFPNFISTTAVVVDDPVKSDEEVN